jgi:hypothetical protein
MHVYMFHHSSSIRESCPHRPHLPSIHWREDRSARPLSTTHELSALRMHIETQIQTCKSTQTFIHTKVWRKHEMKTTKGTRNDSTRVQCAYNSSEWKGMRGIQFCVLMSCECRDKGERNGHESTKCIKWKIASKPTRFMSLQNDFRFAQYLPTSFQIHNNLN